MLSIQIRIVHSNVFTQHIFLGGCWVLQLGWMELLNGRPSCVRVFVSALAVASGPPLSPG
mgnify:CR=1 FL=1